jgi:uncharacterized membrane protein required for colicin V production
LIADLVILVFLLIGIYIGLSRGLIGPLVTEGAFLVALYLVLRLHGLFDGFLAIGFLRTGLSIVLVFLLTFFLRLLARPLVMVWNMIPPLRVIDKPLGAVVHGLIALVLLYLALGVVLDFDRSVYPLLKAGVATANAIENYRQSVQKQPLLNGYLNDQQLKQLEQQAGPSPLPMQQVRQVEGFLNFYDSCIRTPLLTSRAAPGINRVGAGLPMVGHPRPYLTGARTSLRHGTPAPA